MIRTYLRSYDSPLLYQFLTYRIKMISQWKSNEQIIIFSLLLLLIMYFCSIIESRDVAIRRRKKKTTTEMTTVTQKICVQQKNALHAQFKTCFLRPDSGPCRADIIQWYFDVKKQRCYRFWWGGCQGNGNRFDTKRLCLSNCLSKSTSKRKNPNVYCLFPFDYGTCFGNFERYAYDKFSKSCKTRIYSGCGGNQNNFQSQAECLIACMAVDNETMGLTTCVPIRSNLL